MAIPVKNVAELYAAVNNLKNAGKKIILAPGTYTLNPAVDNSNSGRLELQENMELQGQMNHPELVIIDVSALPDASYAPGGGVPARTGAVRLGKGLNVLSGLSVLGKNDITKRTALSIIDTDLVGQGSPRIKISHCIVAGGRIGINVRNVGLPQNARSIEVELSNNVIRENQVSDAGTQQGQGIVLQNANGVSNATITATLKGNHVFGNIIGMRVFNNSNNKTLDTNGNSIMITSKDDQFEKNRLGLYFASSLNQDVSKKVNGNFISFEASRIKVQNNKGINPDPIILPCGIFVAGGISYVANSETSNNRLTMKLTDCDLSGNQDKDIIAFGAFTVTKDPPGKSLMLPPLPGTFNIVKIELFGTSMAAIRTKTDCYPIEAVPTNVSAIVP